MKNYLKQSVITFWKILLLAALILNISCATEEVEDSDVSEVDAELYQGLKKIDLKNAEKNISNGTYYYIRNVKTRKILDLKNYGNNGAINVHQWDCHGTSNQKWMLSDFRGMTRLKSGRGPYLEIQGSSKSNRGNVVVGKRSDHYRQRFKIERRSSNSSQFYIRNYYSNRVLEVYGKKGHNGANVVQYSKNSGPTGHYGYEHQVWEFFKTSDY